MVPRRRTLALGGCLLPFAHRRPWAQTAAEPRLIQYPRSQRGLEDERQYVVQLLGEALVAAGLPHRFVPSRWPMVQTRALRELAEGHGTLQVTWTMSTAEREAQLRPIRIPLYKGLYGWRVMLVRRQEPDRLAAVRTVDDLRQVPLVQGHDWPDTAILRAHGLTVHTGQSFEPLFDLLARGPAAAFPRSVAEVGWDAQRHAARCVIDRHLVLHYPAVVYAFVHRDDAELADALTRGLNRLVANGRMDQLFRQQVASLLAPLALPQRRVIALDNPLLPAEVPLGRRELWFRP